MPHTPQQILEAAWNAHASPADQALVEAYLENSGDPNLAAKKTETTLLMVSVRMRNLKLFTQLLAKKADVNRTNKLGETAFTLACDTRCIGLHMPTTLAAHGANIRHQNGQGYQGIHNAARTKGNTAVIRWLVKQGIAADTPTPCTEEDIPTPSGHLTPLMLAAIHDNPAAQKVLLSLGANPYATTVQGSHALLLASNFKRMSKATLKNLYAAAPELIDVPRLNAPPGSATPRTCGRPASRKLAQIEHESISKKAT